MKLITRALLLLMVFGVTAIAAHADSTNDFQVILNGPDPCPTTAFCVNIGANDNELQTYTESDPLVFYAPAQPIPPGNTVTCSLNGLAADVDCGPFLIPSSSDPQEFLGVAFWGFTLQPNEDLTVGVIGSSLLTLDLPEGYSCDPISACPSNGTIVLTPEPSAVLLLVIGLLALAVFRKRFRALVPELAA